jgi:hypothetical protein
MVYTYRYGRMVDINHGLGIFNHDILNAILMVYKTNNKQK